MITTVTLNASIDKAYQLDGTMKPGSVMRVKEVNNSAGGKGLNVARVVKLCQQPVVATGLVGGFNGQYLEYLLEKDRIPSKFTHIAGETRSCINVLDSEFSSTEYLEPGCFVHPEEEKEFLENYRMLLGLSDVITLSGSLPKGVSLSIYKTMITWAKHQGKKVILDSSGVSFREGLQAAPTLIKPNQDELREFFGKQFESTEDLLDSAQEFLTMGIEYVVTSLGEEGAILLHKSGVYQAIPPRITPVNTVGCGDSMVAALAVGLVNGDSPQDCLRYAVAVGTASALSDRTGYFCQKDFEDIYQKVVTKRLTEGD